MQTNRSSVLSPPNGPGAAQERGHQAAGNTGALSAARPEVQPVAIFSPCRKYRYTLRRRTGLDNDRVINFICLNPSTADEVVNDPTVSRLVTRGMRLGYGIVVVTNIFAWRSTDPMAMKLAYDPIGPQNDGHLLSEAQAAELVVCAWGTHGAFRGRGDQVETRLRRHGVRLHVLRLTRKTGVPEHPLYLPYALEPKLWEKAA